MQIESIKQSIYQACDVLGLSKKEKLARAVNSYLIDPFYSYRLKFWLPIAGATSLLTLYVYWQNFCPRSGEIYTDPAIRTIESSLFGKEAFDHIKDHPEKYNWLQRTLTKHLGFAPGLQLGQPYILPEDRGYINQGLLTIRQVLHGFDPLQTWFAGYIWSKLKPELHEINDACTRIVKMLWNNAKGGIYTDLEVEGNYVKMPRHTLDDIIGLDKVKERLQEALEYIINPALFRNSGKIPCCNFILHGDIRSGKSYTAEGFAGTAMRHSSLPFCYIELPITIFGQWGVQGVIEFIRSKAPCVAFIDEFDLSGPLRSKNLDLVYQLLRGLGQGETITKDPYKPIILFTACNKLEGVDSALKTIGRLGVEIPFEYPTLHDRCQFITMYLANNALNLDEFDIVRLAQKTKNQPFEKIEYCLKRGLNKGIKTGVIHQYTLEEAIDETLHSLYYHLVPHELLPEMKDVLSAHFAGRALTLLLAKGLETLDVVSINKHDVKVDEDYHESVTGKKSNAKKQDYGIILTRSFTDDISEFVPPMALDADIMQMVAGSVAEEMLLGACTNTCDRDTLAFAFWKAVVFESNGLYPSQIKMLPQEERARLSSAAYKRISHCKQEVRVLLEQHKKALQVTAQVLSMLGTLDDRRVLTIISDPEKASAALNDCLMRFKQPNVTSEEIVEAINMLNIVLSHTEILNEYTANKQKEIQTHASVANEEVQEATA
jgi:AAA+ superfamily predicted ATPase